MMMIADDDGDDGDDDDRSEDKDSWHPVHFK